ncbi:MAG TPA: formate--tetrahydrofolate ligase [Alphaproteobacteria bacterium]|nr:formate--tetrahydrofolate ligase [Alphaproteobacteria bacterium]
MTVAASKPKSDIEIARAAKLRPILDLAADRLGLAPERLTPYGHYQAKISLDAIRELSGKPDGQLILVTSISPTPAGEGKTTTSVGLVDALNRIGKKAIIALREPSIGPTLGMKGGAAGGGYAQVVPMDEINLHFTGDLHAIGSANNLLAAMVDNHLYWGNELGIDPRRVSWRRCMDMNDRALRDIVCGLGGPSNGYTREGHFDITSASEVMAAFCLASDFKDLQRRLGNIIVAQTPKREPVRASQLKAEGAMAVLLQRALEPNLVQTLENNPALVHGGPFANIAHGCSSVIATRAALKLADYVVTEAGFGADLGAEKFFDIKCRKAGLTPACAVLVATIGAVKMHGGVAVRDLRTENCTAVDLGLANLLRHLENLSQFGVPVVVAVNRHTSDTDREIAIVRDACAARGVEMVVAEHWAHGSAGAENLARTVVRTIDQKHVNFRLLYDDSEPLVEKVRTVARTIYRARDISADGQVLERFSQLQQGGFGHFPVCIAKTQYSFSTNPKLMGAPSDHVIPIREVRLSAGAEFVVVVCGDIMTMPGLPREPAAVRLSVDDHGHIQGLS